MLRRLAHDTPHGDDIIQALQAKPEGLRSGLTVTLAPEKAAEGGNPMNRFAQARRFDRSDGIARGEDHQRFPLVFFEIYGAGCLRHLAAELGQMIDAPRHDQVDGQAGDSRLRIRIRSPDGAEIAEFDGAFAAALRERGVRVVSDFLQRPGHAPNFVKDYVRGGKRDPPPVVGSIVTVRADDSEDIYVEQNQDIGGGRFRGVIRGFERRPSLTYRGFQVGDTIEFFEENVFAIVG